MNETSFILRDYKKAEKSSFKSSLKMIDLALVHLLRYKSNFNFQNLNIYE